MVLGRFLAAGPRITELEVWLSAVGLSVWVSYAASGSSSGSGHGVRSSVM